ncbi:Phospholipid/glycerol acyltransferase [Corchorus olitorius]|uniref:1-acylglycerol-3-phosphate O-acyltransferase n=1 Tax=Corchorus olitorius TaxID=93759 RepID=A0A1R3I5Y3_9ROSI|nr:Phospholipid/glycerol acyltransferase [Corchorus olitorius]
MAIPAVIVVVPVGVIFFVSGLIVNFIQIELYTDAGTFQLLGKEHALLICNHRSDIDWLVGWVLAQRSSCLGSALAIIKSSVKLLPIIGWSMWFSDYVFLERNWAKDEETLKSGFKQLEDFPMPFWLALFVEGTRFTQAKLELAQTYAASRGLPVPRNVLIPRTKGFVSAVYHMRSFVPAIYDCTLAVSRTQPSPTMLRMFRGQTSVINLQIRRHLMQELPETVDGISQWCKDVFVTKDAMLEKYYTTDSFSELEYHDIGRPKRSLILFQWSSVLASWEVIVFAATFLIIVTIVMQILIYSSESKHSTPPKVSQISDSTREKLLG